MFKRILIAAIFLLGVTSLSAQVLYLGGGFNASFSSPDNLNRIIDQYNADRPFLSEQMDNLRFLRGGSAAFGYGSIQGPFVELSWAGKNQKLSAQASNTGVLQQRDLKVNLNLFSFNFGYMVGSERVSVGFSASVDVGRMKTSTRVGLEAQIKEIDYSEIDKDAQFGSTFAITILVQTNNIIGFSIKPYYQLLYMPYDFAPVQEVFSPGTTSLDGLKDRMSNFGITMNLLIIKPR